MTKVCHMTSVHKPEDVRIFHKECVSLARAGYEICLVQRGGSYEKNGVHIAGFGEVTGGRLKRMTQVARRAYETALAVDADIYHFHDPELLPYGLKLKKKGKKVIFDSHEDTLESILEKEWIPVPARKAMYFWFRNQQEKVCRQIDAVITVAPRMTDFFKALNPRTVQIANFPILSGEEPAPGFQEKRLVFAGGVTDEGCHRTILKALEQIPDCEYAVCGGASDSYLQLLQSYPAWKQVCYYGRVPHEKVAEILSSGFIAMAIAPYSRNSGWKAGTLGNTKIFEGMMAGLPVICTDYTLYQDIIARWHCGICVAPEDPDAVAAAVRYLLDHPEEARQMGENGRKAVKEEFNWGVDEKKLLALYEEIRK